MSAFGILREGHECCHVGFCISCLLVRSTDERFCFALLDLSLLPSHLYGDCIDVSSACRAIWRASSPQLFVNTLFVVVFFYLCLFLFFFGDCWYNQRHICTVTPDAFGARSAYSPLMARSIFHFPRYKESVCNRLWVKNAIVPVFSCLVHLLLCQVQF